MTFPVWSKVTPPPERQPGFLPWVRQSLEELGQALTRWRSLLQFGPVAGAYYPLEFQRHDATLLATPVAHLIPMVPQFAPVAVSAWCDTGQVTAKLVVTGPTDLLTSNLTVTSTSLRRNSGADFALSKVDAASDVWLEVVSIDSGVPTKIVVHLLCKGLTKADSA